ncbi:DsbA family oxidoreductase [Halococcus agarilyticus]|uniref:DsbA family oxidoreductase n=1 Tax=Halococcus agarilyticus TaxID=1232219 RepID=UPI000677F7F6|nr:DsbA family protein [Halococcus agarilyticus]
MNEPESTLVEYADYSCPFCYLTHRSLEQYRRTRDDALAVDWRPFDLRNGKRGPDGEIDDEADIGYPSEVEQRIGQLRTKFDANEMLSLDEVPKVDSLNAQVVSRYVRNEYPNQWAEVNAAIFDALWEDGRDISDDGVLAEIAAGAGVDRDEIHDTIADDERRSQLFERFEKARRDGVTDVPTFIVDGRTTTGVLSPEEIERFVSES